MPTFKVTSYEENMNEMALMSELDLLEEKRIHAEMRNVIYKQRNTQYYNLKVRHRKFRAGDLVLKKVLQNTKELNVRALGPNWKGQYKILRPLPNGSYELETLDGKKFIHPWNAEHLKKYFQ